MSRNGNDDSDVSEEQHMYNEGRRDFALEVMESMGLSASDYADADRASIECLARELAQSYAKHWTEAPDETTDATEPEPAADAGVGADVNRMFW